MREASQCDIILRHLTAGGTLTVAQALQDFGIYALSQRCTELRRKGYPIVSKMIETPTGKRIAQYKMAKQLGLPF